MQLGVVVPPISRHKVVERQWARSTRDQEKSPVLASDSHLTRWRIARSCCERCYIRRQAGLEFLAYPRPRPAGFAGRGHGVAINGEARAGRAGRLFIQSEG